MSGRGRSKKVHWVLEHPENTSWVYGVQIFGYLDERVGRNALPSLIRAFSVQAFVKNFVATDASNSA
ncbi:hypothetical protein GCM10020370_39260 [Paenibacillus hodogayensis]